MLQHFAVGLVIIHYQDTLAGKNVLAPHQSRAAGRLLLQTHGEPEGGPSSDGAFDADTAVHHFHQLFGNREAQSRAAVFAGRGGVGLGERLEQGPLRFGRDSDAGVADYETEGHFVLRLLHVFDLEQDFAPFSEFDGVAEQIEEHLSQAARITPQPFGQLRGQRANQFQVLAAHLLRQ